MTSESRTDERLERGDATADGRSGAASDERHADDAGDGRRSDAGDGRRSDAGDEGLADDTTDRRFHDWLVDAADASGGLAYDVATYERLLEGLAIAGYSFVGFDGAVDDGEVAIRHDVDLSVERALAMAQVEASLGVRSTYCFLVTAPAYDLLTPANRRRLQRIADAGHDVGLHFDPHHYWDEEPAREELRDAVVADRECLAALVDANVDAVSIHVPPSWALDVDFAGFESTYRPAYFSEVGYVSDSSQKWRERPPFADGVPDAMQLLVHPGLWHPADRPIDDVLDDVRDRRYGAVDAYLREIGE